MVLTPHNIKFFKKNHERWDVGKEKTNDKEPCHAKIRPIVEESPQVTEGRRGLGTDSGDKLKDASQERAVLISVKKKKTTYKTNTNYI